jgi:hypothetical protein
MTFPLFPCLYENKDINIIYLMPEQCGNIFLSKIDLFHQKQQNGVFDF